MTDTHVVIGEDGQPICTGMEGEIREAAEEMRQRGLTATIGRIKRVEWSWEEVI